MARGKKASITATLNGTDITSALDEAIGLGEIKDKYDRLQEDGDLPEVKSAALNLPLHLNFTYEESVGAGISEPVSRKGKRPIHQDLRKAFYALGPHLAIACEELDISGIADISVYDGVPQYDTEDGGTGDRLFKDEVDKNLSRFEVHGLRLDGTGEKAGVVLSGTKLLSTGDFVRLESPRIEWEETHPFLHDLRYATETLIEEVQLYKLGKQAPAIQQGELFETEQELEAQG